MEYGVYQTPDNTPDVMKHYVEMYKEMREALDAQFIITICASIMWLQHGMLMWVGVTSKRV